MTSLVVAGAGIAGLTTALALAEAGCRVDVIERRAVLREAGAGLQLSPNATRCLRSLGLREAVLAKATLPQAVRIRRGRDGADIVRMTLGDEAARRYDAPFLLLHRADLHQILTDAVLGHPLITLELGTAVVEVVAQATIEVTLRRDGEARTIAAGGFIEAGGLHARRTAPTATGPTFSGRTAWRALVPADRVDATCREPVSNLWLEARTHMVHYPLRDASIVNVVVIVDAGGAEAEQVDPWAQEGDPNELAHALQGWDRTALRLVRAAPGWQRWPLYDAPPGTRWSFGCQTAIGDAAHPMLPFLAQGASQAIEDAAALARAVRQTPHDLAAAFACFEQARRPVAERVQAASRRQGDVYHLGGAVASARDLAMRLLGPRRMLSRLDWLYGPTSRASSG